MIEATFYTQTASENSITVGELADVLKRKGVQVDSDSLFAWLRENNYLQHGKGYNKPTKAVDGNGLFELDIKTDVYDDGHTVTDITTKVTTKGQQYFINKFMKKTPPAIKKFEAVVSGIAVLPTVGQVAFVLISGMETPNEKCFVSIENLSNAIAKDIRIGDTVEVQGDKILRVLLEKRGGNNAEKKS